MYRAAGQILEYPMMDLSELAGLLKRYQRIAGFDSERRGLGEARNLQPVTHSGDDPDGSSQELPHRASVYILTAGASASR